VQDNDPKHISKATVKWMEDNQINHWPTPPESPDLNPIEQVMKA
jgi:transposase